MDIKIEKAKNGDFTCLIDEKYIYSKYNPKNFKINVDKNYQYIVLGLGLGYEIEKIRENNSNVIYIVEKDKEFYNEINKYEILKRVLEDKKIILLFGDEYKNIKISEKSLVLENKNITKYNKDFYYLVKDYFRKFNKNVKVHTKRILMFSHASIQQDWQKSLEKLGYEVNVFELNRMVKENIELIIKNNPDYVMQVNFDENISKFCSKLKIPYVCWCVDTPQYGVFTNEINNEYNYIFIYDLYMVENLKNKGIRNIYYLPVAANIERFNKIEINNDDRKKYSCDISFIANLTISEYDGVIKPNLSKERALQLEGLINLQHNNINKYVLQEECTDELAHSIIQESNIKFPQYKYLSDKDILALILGRSQSFEERILFVSKIINEFRKRNVKIYGNELWKNYCRDNYCGYAEHYIEMPKIMNLSKINLNITRTFVEAGLPMRIFDVLGCEGFLLTNYKLGLEYRFRLNKDFIIYRDLQELIEIIEYYLNNDEKRKEIAKNGYETIRKYHTYDIRIKEMMDIVKSAE